MRVVDPEAESDQDSAMHLWRRECLAIVVAGVAWASPAGAEQGQPLSGAEIATAIAGNTVQGAKFVEYYDPDGSVRGREGDDKYAGSWRVDGDRLCVTFPEHDFTSCLWMAQQQGNDYIFMDGKRTSV